MRNKSKTFLCLIFAALVCLPIFAPSVLAGGIEVLNATPPYSGAQWGGQNYYEAYANYVNGWVRAKCWKNSWAHARVNQYFTNDEGTFARFEVQITVSDPYVYKNQPAGSTCKAKVWLMVFDNTDNKLVFDDKESKDWGLTWYFYSIPEKLYYNHDYNIIVGVYVKTTWGWFWKYATAEGSGYISRIIVDGFYS